MELLKYPLYYTIEFQLDKTTELLTFSQQLGNAGLPALSLLSISKNGNTLIQNIELSKEKTFTMARNALSLGKSSEANFMLSYITISDTQVSHELTIPFTLFKSFVTLPNDDTQTAFRLIREFIAKNSSVTVNRTVIEPELTTVNFQGDSRHTVSDTLLVNISVIYSLKINKGTSQL